jgi:hypothetical protein
MPAPACAALRFGLLLATNRIGAPSHTQQVLDGSNFRNKRDEIKFMQRSFAFMACAWSTSPLAHSWHFLGQ